MLTEIQCLLNSSFTVVHDAQIDKQLARILSQGSHPK